MALNSLAPFNALYTLVAGLADMQQAYKGAPESLGRQVAGWVALGGQQPDRRTTGTIRREGRYLVTFGYDVAGAESAAEETLCRLVDQFTTAVYADSTLGGTVNSAELDTSGADAPEYRLIAGAETRLYPVVVVVTQDAGVPA